MAAGVKDTPVGAVIAATDGPKQPKYLLVTSAEVSGQFGTSAELSRSHFGRH